jgi:hypothetical protein
MAFLLIPPDSSETLSTLLDPATGAVVSQTAFPSCEQAARSPNGVYCVQSVEEVATVDRVTSIVLLDCEFGVIYDSPDLVDDMVAVDPDAEGYVYAPVVFANGVFYVSRVEALGLVATSIKTITEAGVIGPDEWTLPFGSSESYLMSAMAIAPDGTTLYYSTGLPHIVTPTIRRYDLNTSTPGTAFFTDATATARLAPDMFALADGSVLFSYTPNVSDITAWVVQQRAADGTLVRSFTMGTTRSAGILPPRFTISPDETSIWMMTFPAIGGGMTRIQQYRISDGVQLTDYTIANADSDPNGPSESCPILYLETLCPEEPEPEPEVCIPERASAACWGDDAPTAACVDPHTPTSGACWSDHDINTLTVRLNG